MCVLCLSTPIHIIDIYEKLVVIAEVERFMIMLMDKMGILVGIYSL